MSLFSNGHGDDKAAFERQCEALVQRYGQWPDRLIKEAADYGTDAKRNGVGWLFNKGEWSVSVPIVDIKEQPTASETVDILTQPGGVTLPDGCLPRQLQRWVDESHADNGWDKGALAISMIATASMAIHSGTKLRVKTDWNVRPIIWANIIGDPGTSKSPIIRSATKYIGALEAELEAARRQEIDEAIRAQGLNADDKTAEREAFVKTYPPARRLLVNDATTEALMTLLAEPTQLNSGIGVYRDELSGLVGSMDQYRGGKGADRQMYLEFYHGGPQRKDRVSKGASVAVKCSAVSIVGGMQPDALRKICQKGIDDGWMQRWLYAVLPQGAYSKIVFDHEVEATPHDARRWMQDRMRELLRQDVKTYSLSAGAGGELNAIRAKYHVMVERPETIRSWYAKLAEHWLRVALIFHCIETPDRDEISPEMAKIVSAFFEEFLMPSAEAAFLIMEGSSNLELKRAAEAVLRASAKGHMIIDTRKLKSNVRQLKDKSVEEIEKLISPLVAAGWLTPQLEIGKSGRKPPTSWSITPGLADCYRNHLERAVEVERAVMKKLQGGQE